MVIGLGIINRAPYISLLAGTKIINLLVRIQTLLTIALLLSVTAATLEEST